jgi:hypothetical protein
LINRDRAVIFYVAGKLRNFYSPKLCEVVN